MLDPGPLVPSHHHPQYFPGMSNSGEDYFMESGVVVVTINYRLGPLGFMALPGTNIQGNMGMKDQLLAMRWVKQNIARWGDSPRCSPGLAVTLAASLSPASPPGASVSMPMSSLLTVKERVSSTGPLLTAAPCSCLWRLVRGTASLSDTLSSRKVCLRIAVSCWRTSATSTQVQRYRRTSTPPACSTFRLKTY